MANQDKRQARNSNGAKGSPAKSGSAKGRPVNGSAEPAAPAAEPSRAERRASTAAERRRERLKAPERQQRQRSMARIGLAAVVVLIIAGIGYGIYSFTAKKTAKPPDGVQTYANLSRDHVETPVTYPQTPPVGGAHSAVWQNCGFYSAPVGNEHGVHSMEHGAVWITYSPNLASDQVDILKGIAQQTYILVSPYPNLGSPIVATAWGNQLKLDSASDPRLDQFVKYFREGPQTPEPGAACTGGTSATVG